MFKKILSLFTIFNFIFFGISFAEELKGPTSKPSIVGPVSAPPTMIELKKIKCTKDPDFINTDYCKKKDKIGIFQKIWNWILSLFK